MTTSPKASWTFDNLARAGVVLILVLLGASYLLDELFNDFFMDVFVYVAIPLSAAVFGTAGCFVVSLGVLWLVLGNSRMNALLDSSRAFRAFMLFNAVVGSSVMIWAYFFSPFGGF